MCAFSCPCVACVVVVSDVPVGEHDRPLPQLRVSRFSFASHAALWLRHVKQRGGGEEGEVHSAEVGLYSITCAHGGISYFSFCTSTDGRRCLSDRRPQSGARHSIELPSRETRRADMARLRRQAAHSVDHARVGVLPACVAAFIVLVSICCLSSAAAAATDSDDLRQRYDSTQFLPIVWSAPFLR